MVSIDTILQVLSNPAWTGVGVIVSSCLSVVALHRARQPHTQQISSLVSKKTRLRLKRSPLICYNIVCGIHLTH